MSEGRGKDRPAGDLAGLQRWIASWADASGEPVGRLSRRVGVMVLAAMLDRVRDEEGTHRFAVKGGSAMELRYVSKARVSRDVDLLFRGALTEVHELLVTAVTAGWSGFSGRVLDPSLLDIPWGDTAGLRFQTKLTYRGKPFSTLILEVVTSPSTDLELIASLSLVEVGLKPPLRVPCLALVQQVAEKLHACTDPLDGERTNERASDLMDLILMEELSLAGSNLRAARAACVDLFARRDSHPWPPVLSVQPSWQAQWANLVDGYSFHVRGIDEAVARVNALIASIDAAT